MKDEILKMFENNCMIQIKYKGYITAYILQYIMDIWERQISTDKEEPGIYRDDFIEYEITKDNDIIILDVF